jgi:hypothetical protein
MSCDGLHIRAKVRGGRIVNSRCVICRATRGADGKLLTPRAFPPPTRCVRQMA